MSDQIATIDGKLKAWHLSAGNQSPKSLINEIYKGVFAGDFYRDIWDEPVLLGVQDLIAQHPPDPEVFGRQLHFIRERIHHVVVINDLFAAVLFGTSEELLAVGCRLPGQPQVAQGLACLQANGALDKLRGCISQPAENSLLLWSSS